MRTPRTTFAEPTAAPGSTGYTLNQLYDLASQRARPGKTGQTRCYNAAGTEIACAGTGRDGQWQKGVPSPSPRFTDNGNGTVTDNLTGLIWLKNANCFGTWDWANALTSANTLNSGECGLTDGSAEGAWRLPNCKELESLLDLGRFRPALPSGHPFSGVQMIYYWSSSSHVGNPGYAWVVDLSDGAVYAHGKPSHFYVWPVRGGQ